MTDRAISLAESGDAVGALALFEQAVTLNPKNARFHENLGVTQVNRDATPSLTLKFTLGLVTDCALCDVKMRVGLLIAAKKSFDASKGLGGPTKSLADNAKALKDHQKYAKSINHDQNTMYAEFASASDSGDGVGLESDDDDDDDLTDPYESSEV